ncbi:amidohydrolase [Ferruginibacter sp.]|uniref:amidohydrolase n=1 Tax=Ferruginibacter sp. TaxID=1940288 RepID=UPI0019AF75E3|nr:amidohydrolase [Ferruginibacter sp.]MBC7626778.1 amidohydrolase [Ferruginibacter sp.]
MSSLTLTIIQTDLSWENKAANLQRLKEKIEAMDERTEIVVLPEMFSTGFTMVPELFAETMEGETVAWMKEMAENNKIIITGSLIIEEDGQYFNRLIWMLPNGQTGHYDKRHLFGYGDEDKHYTPGNKRLIASVKGWRINLQVCYDLRFPVWSRQQYVSMESEYDLLIYVANWPERRSHAWKTLLCARAIENQCFVAGVNRVGKDNKNVYFSGDSLVIDPLGQVLYHMPDAEDVFTITLQKEEVDKVRTQFPFWKDADAFTIH